MAAGRSNGAIAASLFLTKRAVEKHINAIFLKLGLREYEDTSRRVTAALIYLADSGSRASPTEALSRLRRRRRAFSAGAGFRVRASVSPSSVDAPSSQSA